MSNREPIAGENGHVRRHVQLPLGVKAVSACFQQNSSGDLADSFL